ncbi:hypothetical protein F9C07_8619 [Aspergillus flavus]|uniref:Uncharacterized protein n=1 Tax=Aspergillus flavus (strain ATCC 200026 / FGSC A1120 / IAM 13836 / NRRL 3357 / JCM 12722 / SRRC 167) TaxID=332952 RepID=A0A7U2QVG4_ASPFN|nr:hypothetical protein F9C07_8619 [Aspergillus flavus]
MKKAKETNVDFFPRIFFSFAFSPDQEKLLFVPCILVSSVSISSAEASIRELKHE